MLRLRIAILAASWVIAGCSSGSGSGASLRISSEQPSQVPASPVGGSPGTNDLPATIVDPIVAEIARVASVSVDAVVVQSAEVVTFPDGSLGCPLPGMSYTQVQVDGYRITAVAAGTTYDYRGSGPGNFRRCQTPAG
jgi:hypothetical protein